MSVGTADKRDFKQCVVVRFPEWTHKEEKKISKRQTCGANCPVAARGQRSGWADRLKTGSKTEPQVTAGCAA